MAQNKLNKLKKSFLPAGSHRLVIIVELNTVLFIFLSKLK